MHELTGYLLTTERVHAAESLASLRAQGIPREIVVIRNIRPLHAAHFPTLECETPYCLIVDDDVIMEPGVAQTLIDRFRSLRKTRPNGFKLNARLYCEARERWGKGGIKMFHTPHLRQVGWPDSPHVSSAQKEVASKLGFKALECDIKAGVQKRGSNLDVYKKYLWIQARAEAGQHRAVSIRKLIKRIRATGKSWLWFAVLGVVDGARAGTLSTSKDEAYLGPIGRTLNFDTLGARDIINILTENDIVEAAGGRSLLKRLGLRR